MACNNFELNGDGSMEVNGDASIFSLATHEYKLWCVSFQISNSCINFILAVHGYNGMS